MMPAQVQQIEREIAHLESAIDGYRGTGLAVDAVRVDHLRAEVRRKWLLIKPFVTAGQLHLKDAARNG